MHTVILLAFIDVFCMNVDLYYVLFRHSLYWTYDTAYRCHAAVSSLCGPVQAGELKGITPYHTLLNNTFNFNLLGLIFYTPVCKEERLWKPMQLWQEVCFRPGSG